ncbi:MAG: ATP-binding cassette domain-containing protein [bacterium]|nr:ATP-binding cassette domain-containing protein [bacterium]
MSDPISGEAPWDERAHAKDPRSGELAADFEFARENDFTLRLKFRSPLVSNHDASNSGEEESAGEDENAGEVSNRGVKQPARILGVYGASGAGKSTLLHLWAGLLRPRTGCLRFGSRVFFFSDGPQRAMNLSPAARRVGYIFQDTRVFPHLSVGRNVLYGAPDRSARRSVEFMESPALSLERVRSALGLEEIWNRSGSELSGGQQKRVAIARALLSQPELLLCDEAAANLDARSGQAFREIMRDLPAGTRAIYVSHDLAEIARLTEELLVLDRGALLYHGSPAGLPAVGPVRDMFFRAGEAPPLLIRSDQMRISGASQGFRISDRYRGSGSGNEVFVIPAASLHLASRASEDLSGFPDRWPARFIEFVEVGGESKSRLARVAIFEEGGPECLVPLGNAAEDRPAWQAGEALICLISTMRGLA